MKFVKLFAVLIVSSFLMPLSACASVEEISQALRRDYPALNFQKVSPGPVAGIYQVVADQSEIVYYVPESGYLITGEIWTRDSQNLTRMAKADIMTEKSGLFPLDKALVIGKGPHQVIEVVDPDCPYCREGSAFFAGRNDVTRYVFFFPLNIHEHAAEKAAYVLSSSEPEFAYEEVMGGAFDSQPIPEFKDNGVLKVHQQVAQQIGIHGTPQYWVNGRYVAGSNLNLVGQMLGGNQKK